MNRLRSLWATICVRIATRDDSGLEVVQVAIIAAGATFLALLVMGAIYNLVTGELPWISSPGAGPPGSDSGSGSGGGG